METKKKLILFCVGLATRCSAKSAGKFLIAFGRTSRNGKGTFQAAINAMMGDYVGNASEKMIIKGSKVSDGTQQEYLAALTGKRFTSISELPRNSQLDGNLLRQVTGDDPLNVCRKYKESTEIKVYPHITCWTNYLPRTNDPKLFETQPHSCSDF